MTLSTFDEEEDKEEESSSGMRNQAISLGSWKLKGAWNSSFSMQDSVFEGRARVIFLFYC